MTPDETGVRAQDATVNASYLSVAPFRTFEHLVSITSLSRLSSRNLFILNPFALPRSGLGCNTHHLWTTHLMDFFHVFRSSRLRLNNTMASHSLLDSRPEESALTMSFDNQNAVREDSTTNNILTSASSTPSPLPKPKAKELLDLNNETLSNMVRNLDAPAAVCLALTCKHLESVVTTVCGRAIGSIVPIALALHANNSTQ